MVAADEVAAIAMASVCDYIFSESPRFSEAGVVWEKKVTALMAKPLGGGDGWGFLSSNHNKFS